MKTKAEKSHTIPAKRHRPTPVAQNEASRQQPAESKPSVSDKNENPSTEESNKNGEQPITNQDEQDQITNKGSSKPGSF
jgi:hypothetical protein